MKQMNHLAILIFILIGSYFITGSVYAEPVQKTINFQGYLTTSDGVAVMDDTYTMTFSHWDGPNDSTATKLWEETVPLSVTRGIYSVNLGETNPFPYSLNFGEQYYIGVQVENDEIMKINGSLIPIVNTWHVFRADSVGGRNVRSINQSSTLDNTDDIVFTTGDITVNLPSAADVPEKWYTIKKMDDDQTTLIINASSGELINDTGSVTIKKEFVDLSIISNGLQWYSLGISDVSELTKTQFADAAITSDKIVNNTITNSDIQNSAIDTSQLADNGVTSDKIVDNTIAGSDIQNSAINTTQLADGSVIASKLANNPGNGTSGQRLNSNGDGTFVWADAVGAFSTTLNTPPIEDTHTVETGNVGIGTISPTEKLEVDGNVKITNDLILANGSSSVSQTILNAMTQSEARTISLPDASGIVVVTDDGNIPVPDGSITASKLANNPGNGTSGDRLISNGDGSFGWESAEGAFTTSEEIGSSSSFDYSFGSYDIPIDIAVDSSGSIYVVDRDNCQIQVFTASGTFSYSFGSSGTGQGEFDWPSGIAIDSNDNIYVADKNNDRIQVFTVQGNFSYSITNAGSMELNSPIGIAFDNSGNLYVNDAANYCIQVFTAQGDFSYSIGTGIRGSGQGEFKMPMLIAVDNSGKIYVADQDNNRIHIFTAQGDFSYSIGILDAEPLEPGSFFKPIGVAVDSNGLIYVADTANNRIQVFTSSGAYSYSISQLGAPHSIKVYKSKIYVADSGNKRVMIYNLSSQINHTAETGNVGIGITPTEKLEVDGNIKITNDLIFANGSSSVSQTILKAMTQTEARTITLPDASGVVVVSDDGNATLPDGSITAAKLANNPGNGSSGQVIVSNGDGSFDWGSTGGAVLTQGSDSTILDYSIGEEGSAAGQFIVPFDIALDSNNNIYVVDTYNHRIQVFTASGDFSYTIGKRGNGQKEFFAPSGIAIDSNNNIYIGDSFNHQVQVLNASGDFSYSLGSGSLSSDPGKFNQPSGVVVDTNGNFYVADVLNHRIQVFTADGNYSFSFGTQGSDPGQFHSPVKVALDNSGYIYVADSLNHRIQVFTAQCEFSYSIGTGSEGSDPGKFNTPQGVDVDSNGRIYVADTENFRIQVFTASGAYDYSINLQENKPYSVKVYNNKIYVTCGHSVVVYNCPSQITHTIASGNVGIGITPTEKLEIDGNVKITNGLILANGSSSVSQTILKSMTQSEARTITLPDAPGIAVVTEDGNITVSDGSITASKLADNPGNGITGQVLFSNGDGSFVWQDVEWPFTTTQSGVHTVETGNVGIGTTSPTETLEVDGNVKITNNLILANGSSSVSQTILKAMTQSEARTITLPDASGIVVVTDDGNITIPDGSITTSKLANNPGNGITGQTLVSNGDGTFGWAGFVTTQGATTTHTVEDGNVGIGTTSPTETFEINGTVHINNALKFQPISYTPAEATAGTLFYDNDTHKLKVYDGTEWKNCF